MRKTSNEMKGTRRRKGEERKIIVQRKEEKYVKINWKSIECDVKIKHSYIMGIFFDAIANLFLPSEMSLPT